MDKNGTVLANWELDSESQKKLLENHQLSHEENSWPLSLSSILGNRQIQILTVPPVKILP